MALTKVSGGILDPGINVAGIVTATGFDGPFIGGSDGINAGVGTFTGLDVNGNGDISGNLVVGGNLTANGDFTTLNTTLREVEILHVDANSSEPAGIITQTGAGDLLRLYDGTSQVVTVDDTGNVGLGSAIPAAKLDLNGSFKLHDGSGYGNHITFTQNVASILFPTGPLADLTKTPYLGFGDRTSGGDFKIYHDYYNTHLKLSGQGGLYISNSSASGVIGINGSNGSGNVQSSIAIPAGATAGVKLYQGGNLRLETVGYGVTILGTTETQKLNVTGISTFEGNIDANGDLDVDGQTHLDDVSITGVTTATGNITISSAHPKLLLIDDTNPDFSVHVNASAFHIRNETVNTNDFRITSDGTVELYHGGNLRFETGNTVNINSAHLEITSGQQLRFDNSNNDRSSEILNTGSSGNSTLAFKTNGGTRWTIDSSGHLLPETAGAVNIGSASAEIGHVYLADSKNVYLGSDQDMTMGFDSSNALISLNTGTLSIINYANNEDVKILSDNGSGGVVDFIVADGSTGEVLLNHYGSQKLATSTTGISVTGEVAASQDYPTLQPTLDINFANTKSLDPRINYVRTGTASYLNEFGKIVTVGENVPRFDHDPTTLEPKGLLIEESRQNMFGATADMGSNAGRWPVGGARGRRGVNVEGPDGTMTALQNIYLGTSGDLNIYYETSNGASSMTTTNSTVYTFSVFAKAAGNNTYINGIRLRAWGPERSVSYNVISGTVGASNEGSSSISSKTIVEYPNGWYRCIMTFTSGTDGNQGFQIYIENEGGDNAALNNSSANGEAMYFWGAQLEIGSFATSFIPAQSRDGRNRGSQTIRGLDIVTIDKHDIDGIFNPEEGTMFYEAAVTNLTNDNQPIVAFRDFSNTAVSYHAMGHAIGGSVGSVRTWAKNTAGSNIHLTSHSGLVAGSFYKHMYGYKYNDYSDAFGQGTTLLQSSGSSGNHAMVAAGVIDELRFGGYYTSPEGTYTLDSGHIRRFSYWPKKLTNTQIKTYVS